MQQKLVDNLENIIPFEAETRDHKIDELQNAVVPPYEGFDKLISQYYYAKSVEQDTSSLEFAENLEKSSEELAFSILTKAAIEPRQILLKLNILENELAIELENGGGLDGRYLVMFAGLKADLIRLIAANETF